MKVFKSVFMMFYGAGKKLSCLSALVLLAMIFTSCENFMNGSGLQEELNTSIEYANAKKHIILVTGTTGEGTILAGLGENEKKVTDRIHIKFEVAEDYRFIKWQAVNKKNSSILMADYITFEDAYEADTYATFEKESDEIVIMPLCEKMQTIEQAEPEDEKSGTARDSTITVALLYPLESEVELSKIKINLDGINVTDAGYFMEPQVVTGANGKENIIIRAERTNLIPVTTGSTRTVTVTFPSNMKYIGKNGTFAFERDLNYSYRINSSTGEKSEISFESELAEGGVLKVDGQELSSKKYSIGEKIELSCKIADGYKFNGWDIGGSLSLLITPKQGYEFDEQGFNTRTQTAEATVEILNGSKLTVKALISKIPTVNLKFATSMENSGTVKINGVTYSGEVKKYFLGDEITLTFRKNNEYFFRGVSLDNNIYTVKYAEYGTDMYGYDSEIKTATVTLTIVTQQTVDEPQTVILYTPEIPYAYVDVSSSFGRFSNDASRNYREGETQTIGFTSDPDYQFVKWQVIDLTTKRELSDDKYIKIADVSRANTSFDFVSAPEEGSTVKLSIQPMCEKRPKVVSYSPLYTTDGDLRDRTLVVMFNSKMDESSIYYSKDELIKLGVLNSDGTVKANYKLLGKLENNDCYGYYEISNPDKSVVFKNIRICKLNNQSENLLKYYDKPVFDKGNSGILRIPTKIKDEVTGIDEAPPKNCEILVTIENGVNYKSEYTVNSERKTSYINLSEELSWAYYTNNDTDSAPPEFSKLNITLCDESQKDYVEAKTALNTIDDLYEQRLTRNINNIKTYNAQNGHIFFNVEVKDAGSGVSSVQAHFTKLNDKYYPTKSGSDEDCEDIIRLENKGSSNLAKIEQNINLADYDFDEGLYAVFIKATDKNDHVIASESYQFVFDNVAPAILSDLVELRKESQKAELSWTKPEELDFAKVVIERKNTKTNATDEITVTSDEAQKKILDDMIDFNRYEYTAKVYDYSGNVSEPKIFTDEEVPVALKNFAESRTESGKAKLSWTKPEELDIAEVHIHRVNKKTNEEDDFIVRSTEGVSKTLTAVDFNRYEYTAKVYDFSGNVSEEVIFTNKTTPGKISNLKEVRTSGTDAKVSWTVPAEVGKVLIKRYNSNNVFEDEFEVLAGENYQNYTTLVNGTRYIYKVTTTDYSGNENTETEDYTDTKAPAKATGIGHSRTSADKETITWTKPADGDFDHIKIVQYDTSSNNAKTGEKTVDKSLTQIQFTDLENQHKYAYKISAVDYSGNEGEITEYQDDVGPTSLVSLSNISNSRTSAANESVSWSANPTGSDVDHIVIKQYDGTTLNNTFTQSSASTKTASFAGLTNQHKYKYRFYSVDYSGNISATYTEYQDNKGPTSLVSLSNISNSRTSAEKESVSWSANPTGSDVDHIVIKQYDGTILNNTFTQSSASTKTASFAGLINQHKYQYRFYSVDYSGNLSESYTGYQDDTPPAYITIRYSEGRNGKVNVFFTTPNEEDYCKTTVSFGTADATQYDISSASGRNNSSYITFNDGINGVTYYYHFRTYDYSGNCRGYWWHEEMAGAMPGMICYAPGNSSDNIFCSKNYWAGKNPIGIVADGSNQSKVKILALDQSAQSEYVYGPNNGDFCSDNTYHEYRWNIPVYTYKNGENVATATVYYNNQEGLEWYKLVRDNPYFKGNMTKGSIWDYLYNVKNKNSPVTWWVPARHEWQFVALNWRPMCSALEAIWAGGGSATTITDKGVYYVSTPNYYNNRCNFIGINTNDSGNLNEYLAFGEWMSMYTTSYKQDKYYRTQKYYAYVRAMAFVDMR